VKISEDLVEQQALSWFQETGWSYLHGSQLTPDLAPEERADGRAVVLTGRLTEAVRRLNPQLPHDAVEEVVRRATTRQHPDFVLFEDDGDAVVKKIAGYHQFHGVREAVRVIAFYDALAERPDVLLEMGDETLRKLAVELTKRLRSSTTVDWLSRESVRAKMRLLIKRLLRKYKYPPEGQEAAVELVIEQAERLSNNWSAAS